MAAPDSELLPEDAWNGVTLAIKVADREAVDTSTPLPWRPALGNRWQIAWLPGYR